MALSADANIPFETGTTNELPVDNAVQVYIGSMVGLHVVSSVTYGRALVAGDVFAGFSLENVLGNTSAAIVPTATIRVSGLAAMALSGAAAGDENKEVFASDDATLTYTATGNTRVGSVYRWVSSGQIILAFNAGASSKAANLSAITDSTGGTTTTPNTFSAVTVPAAITDNTTGTAAPTTGVLAIATEQTVVIPTQNLDFINSGAITLALPYAFTVISALYRTNKPATTGSKAATLTLSTSTGAVTGGVVSLTSANLNTQGGTNAMSAISGANATVAAGGTIIVTASSVTTFVEGDGWIEVTVQNNSLANEVATVLQGVNAATTALGVIQNTISKQAIVLNNLITALK